jgi:hypothetical protein
MLTYSLDKEISMNMPTRYTVKTSLFFALVTAAASSGVVLAQNESVVTPPTQLMKYHDNTVNLKIQTRGYRLLSGTYTTSDQRISGGQDPDGKNKPGQTYDVSGGGSINFSVGRKGSKAVADWFSAEVGGNNNTFGKNPGELNFAFAGNLNLSIEGDGLNPDQPVSFSDIFLAQGHSASSNNWWFGGYLCTKVIEQDTNKVICDSANYPSMKFTFTRGNIDKNVHTPVDEVFVDIEKKN